MFKGALHSRHLEVEGQLAVVLLHDDAGSLPRRHTVGFRG